MPSPYSTSRTAASVLAAALLLAACGSAPSSLTPSGGSKEPSADPTPTPEPTATLTPAAATPAPSSPPPTTQPSGDPVVVTIRVAESQEYRVRLTDPDDIEIARELLADDPDQLATIPNGRIVRGDPGVNTGYSWHIDPDDFEWAEITIEVCDGLPSDVSAGIVSGDRYCPWQAEVVDIQPADSAA